MGYGSSGRRLHMPSVMRARAADRAGVFGRMRPCAIDPDPDGARERGWLHDEARLRSAIDQTGDLDPAVTVVHICTPPVNRIPIMATLARFGFTKFIVEKPLALSLDELDLLHGLVHSHELDVGVAMPWLSSRVTRRLEHALAEDGLGRLRRVDSIQDKPRFQRSLRIADHPSAFDIELPHALGVVTHLLGAAHEVVSAGCCDLEHEFGVVAHVGGAWIRSTHGGIPAELQSNLAAPLRQRLVRLRFESTIVTGFYSISGEDPYAQVTVERLRGSAIDRSVFVDDPFPRMIGEWYQYFAGVRTRPTSDLTLNDAVVRTLAQAKKRAGLDPSVSTSLGVQEALPA